MTVSRREKKRAGEDATRARHPFDRETVARPARRRPRSRRPPRRRARNRSGHGLRPARPTPRPRLRASTSRSRGPALRANPFPEVTDPICRLPLPTLFYRPEAVHLGDLLRMWVRPGAKFTVPPSDFHGATSAHRTPPELRCSAEATSLSRYKPIPGSLPGPYEEKRTLPGTDAAVSEFACVAAPDRRERVAPADLRVRVREC